MKCLPRLLGGVLISACLPALAIDNSDTDAQQIAQLETDMQKIRAQNQALMKKMNRMQAKLATLEKRQKTQKPIEKKVVVAETPATLYTKGMTVTTSPFLGTRSAFDASDLIVNLSSMNEDLRFLQQRSTLQKMFEATTGQDYLPRPLVELSGKAEGQSFYQRNYQGVSRTDIDLTGANLEVLAAASEWATGYLQFDYDNSQLASAQPPESRVANSRIFLNRGFVTIGDIDKSPFYFTVGQIIAPFGQYTSLMLTNPLTLDLAKTRTRAANLGFYKNGFYAQTYAYKGDSFVSNSNIVNSWGANAGYNYQPANSQQSFSAGAGYIANLADSLGMQSTGGPTGTFQGFGSATGTEQLVRSVPAGDVRGQYNYGPFMLIGEYIASLRSFDSSNLSFNGHGARPTALHFEGDYNFKAFNRPTAVGIAYGQSQDALGLFIPKDMYAAFINMSIWKNTIETLEYRRDHNYPGSDTSSGNGATTPVNSQGGNQNTVTAQVGVYF